MKGRESSYNPIFKERLKDLMKEHGFTQKTLSEYTKTLGKEDYIATTTIALWCTGNYFPSQKKMSTLCKVFNVSEDYLIGNENIKKWNKNAPKTEDVHTTEKTIAFLSTLGIETKIYSSNADSGEYEVTYSYNGVDVGYLSVENDCLLKDIKDLILNLIFSHQATYRYLKETGSI